MPQSAGRRALLTIFLIVFLDLLGAGILIPVFPFLVRNFDNDALTVGLMSTVFSLAQFAATPVLGVLSDRYGRRPVLLISLLGTAFGYFLFGWAGSLLMMFVSRIIDGITGGNISTAQAYIADVSAPEDRAKNFGLIGAAFGLGFIVGPALGGLFAKISLTAPAFAAGWFSLFTFVAAFFFLPESLPKEQRAGVVLDRRKLNPLVQIGRALARPELRLLLLAFFAANFAMAGLQTNFALYSADRFGLGPEQNAVIFACIGITGAFTQGYLIRRLTGRDPFQLAVIGFCVALFGFSLVALAPSLPWLYPACMVIALGMGLLGPAATGLLSRRVAQEEQGAVLGVNQSLASLARVIGPVWAGLFYDYAARTSPYWSGAAWLGVGLGLMSAASRLTPSPAASTPSSRATPSSR